MDCIVIGGGPAGLAAAVYLARFRRSVSVLDSGQSRARLIPCTNNLPGFPDGISGPDLMARLESQVARFGVPIDRVTVTRVRRVEECFTVEAGDKTLRARTILLSTGIVDRWPPLANLDELIEGGLVRLCPVCDAYEMIGRSVGVLGPSDRAAAEASFLRTYTEHVTMIATGSPGQAENDLLTLDAVTATTGIPAGSRTSQPGDSGVIATLRDGRQLQFDALYLALGGDPGSSLGAQLGVEVAPGGCIIVDRHQRTRIPGLYAAGDVVNQLDQISVAFGHAAIAATSIHNDLRNRTVEPALHGVAAQ